MKILIYSPAFYPSIGGLEMVMSILAREFVQLGHEVKVVSTTPAAEPNAYNFDVVRCPGPKRLLELTRWCDVFFQANVSLKGIWPLLIFHRPYWVTHHGWYARLDNSLGWRGRLKFLVARFANNISVSHAVAEHVPFHSTVIHNPYREDIFYLRPEVKREKDLIFLGRLVSDKGADILLNALARLKARGLGPRLTIVGDGPEEASLRGQVRKLGINNQVEFTGRTLGTELAELLNAHKILIVPSRVQEGFGVVALEGIACGCVVVGSENGGLRDAIGPCGITFPNGDIDALAQTLASLLSNDSRLAAYRAGAAEHLSCHTGQEVATAYLRIFEQAISS